MAKVFKIKPAQPGDIHWAIEQMTGPHAWKTVSQPYPKKSMAENHLKKLRRRYPFFIFQLTELVAVSNEMAKVCADGY